MYAITFSKLEEIPDLASNEEVMSHIVIKQRNAESYVIESDINDTKLKELIQTTFDLKAGQVFVTSRRIV
ncbi:hypothetical protein C0J00_03540 [Streptococcus pluranimalium]|uniref:Uncharacterized protein n=1 Tax=Streptococcus pluranimalium TaxID=82348 RepID=A0A2L0D770_9STRE|nr:hypothetical protein C0J00_03540 [Streptococcus pluranimalium]